jgi:hypothetical protein
VHQGLVGGPQNEGADNVGINEVGKPVTLSSIASDVIPQSFFDFCQQFLRSHELPRRTYVP